MKTTNLRYFALFIIILITTFFSPFVIYGEDDGKHQWGEWITDVKPTCISEGHKYRICNKFPGSEHIEEALIPKTNTHEYIEEIIPSTCTESEITIYTCKYCKKSYEEETAPKLDHQYSDWLIIEQATIEKEGTKRKTCINNPEHFIDASIPMISKPIEKTSNINSLDIVLTSIGILEVALLAFLIGYDMKVLLWCKNQKKEFMAGRR